MINRASLAIPTLALLFLSAVPLCAQTGATQVSEWQTVYVKGRFSFSLPSDMALVSKESSIGVLDETGIRRFAGGAQSAEAVYAGERMRLSYMYGQATVIGGFEREPELKDETVEIGGRKARVVTFRSSGTFHGRKYAAVMTFVDDKGPALMMWVSCASTAEQEQAKRVFESVRFLLLAPPA